MKSAALSFRPTSKQILLVCIILVVTLVAVAWALYARIRWGFGPLEIGALIHFDLNPYIFGVAIQSLAVPLALIYLFSRTRVCQDAVIDVDVPHQSLKLLIAFSLLQFLALNYELGLFFPNPDRVTLGILVVVTAGLVGGWRVGLGVGIVTMLITGTMTSVIGFPLRDLFPIVYRDDGLWGLIKWLYHDVFFRLYLINLRAMAPIWAGLVAGLWAEIANERRFDPVVLFVFGVVIELAAGYLAAIQSEFTLDIVHMLIPSALVTGLAFAVVGLIVRNVQAESAQRKAEATELALARAELRALRAQINPHFLFNALNTIRYCVRTDPDAARRLLLDLSEVFQRALRSGEFSPLRDEIRYVEAYLDLEKARLGERLKVIWSLPGDESIYYDQPIPTLTLQPVVENAVIHAIAPQQEGGTVSIRVVGSETDLLLQVSDDGVGMSPTLLSSLLSSSGEPTNAIGLRNVDGRLRALYGEAYGLLIESQPGVGTQVEIKVPLSADD